MSQYEQIDYAKNITFQILDGQNLTLTVWGDKRIKNNDQDLNPVPSDPWLVLLTHWNW